MGASYEKESTFSEIVVAVKAYPDRYLLKIMCLLVRRSREKSVRMALGCTACAWSLPLHGYNLLSDELVSDLFLPHAISDKILDVGRAILVWVSACSQVERLCTLRSVSATATTHHALHLNFVNRALLHGDGLRPLEGEVVSVSLFNMHGAKLFELFGIVVHVGVVELFIRGEEDRLGFFHARILFVSLFYFTLLHLEIPRTRTQAQEKT